MSDRNPFFIDFEAIDRRNEQWREDAKQEFVNGLDPVDIRPGMKVTISPNLRIYDRSYTNELLTVIAANSASVQVRRKHGDPVILAFHEHHFYAADDFDAGA